MKHLPCRRPRRKRKASAKSRDLSSTGAELRLTSCLGGRVAGGASLASQVSRDSGSCVSFSCGLPVSYRAVPEAAVGGVSFLCCSAGACAQRLMSVSEGGVWRPKRHAAAALLGRAFFPRQGPGVRWGHRVSKLLTNSPIPERPRASRCVLGGRLGPGGSGCLLVLWLH